MKIGDRVQYSTKFLRSIQCYELMPKGTVLAFLSHNRVEIKWDDGTVSRSLKRNLTCMNKSTATKG